LEAGTGTQLASAVEYIVRLHPRVPELEQEEMQEAQKVKSLSHLLTDCWKQRHPSSLHAPNKPLSLPISQFCTGMFTVSVSKEITKIWPEMRRVEDERFAGYEFSHL
jgi:hypothetical protein